MLRIGKLIKRKEKHWRSSRVVKAEEREKIIDWREKKKKSSWRTDDNFLGSIECSIYFSFSLSSRRLVPLSRFNKSLIAKTGQFMEHV